MTSPRLFSGIPAIAEHLGVPPRRIYRLLERPAVKSARLPLWKLGSHWCADPRDLDQWITLQRTKAGASLPE